MKKRKWMLALVMGCALWLAMSGWGIQSAKADGYNATAAVEYARLHWNDDCPIKAHADNDCAHFVAQCLAAGGINVPDQWYPNHYTSSADNAITWAPSQLSWLTDQGYQLIRPFSNSDVAVGDLVYCTWGNGIEHVYICNAVDNGVPKLAAHTKNRYDYSINNLSTSQRWGLVKLGGAIQQTHLGAHTLGINYPKYKTETTELQNYLNELGYGLVVDGDYGTNTANAVKDFQSKHGLEQDGIFGPASYQALMDELNKNRDTAAPSISNVRITDVGSGEYTICCDVSDNVGVTSVRFPTWCEGQSGEDAIWHEGTITGNTASCRIRCVDHNDRTGCTYYTHIYAYDAAGNSTSVNQDQYGCLAEEMPGRVSVSTYSGTTLQEVTIQWNATNCSDWYDLRIYNASGEEIIGFGQIRSSMFKIELPTGEYQTNVCSVNRNGMWVGCGNVSFSVWEGTAGEAGTDVKAIEADHQRFVFYEKDCTWLEADKIASRSRGTFASITNAVQQEAITKAMGELGCSYWLGAEVYRTGQWRWVDGSTFSYSNWGYAQPDNGYGSENYLEINSGGTWNDCPNDANGYDASLWARVRGYILRYEPVGITVSPRQAQYAAGHNFSTDDFKVLVTFEDGATVETTDYEINVSNSGSGERTAIIRYGDLSAQCNVLIGNVVEGIRFSVDSVTMAAGEQQSLEVIYEPANATLTALQWESSNEAVATISENGIVTAIASGKAIITARTVYGEAVAECAVTVITPVSFKVTIEKNMWSKINTETDCERILQSMKAILTYDDGSTATITDYQWKNDFSPMSILNGEEEKKVGTYIFTLTYGALEDRMVITFIEPVTGVSINKEQLTLKVEETETLVAQVYPANATVQSVLWASENENVATVSKSGEITAKGRGETKITVTTLDGSYKAECKVTVKADGMDSPDFILPKAMKRIEEEAFMGVGASVIQCPEGLTRIGVRAFANCPKLRQIYIPESCTYIDKSAFDGCSATLTIFGKGDSIAEMYARAYGINFEEVNP